MKVIIFVCSLAFWLAFMYGLGCFYFVTTDITQWSEGGRLAFVMFSPVALFVSSFIFAI